MDAVAPPPVSERMGFRLALLVILVIATATSAARGQAERQRPVHRMEQPLSLLWIAAHPDDEVLAAPLLARECVEKGARCTFLILTRGERGECLLAEGCDGDLRNIRGAEAGYASGIYGADLILLGLPDGGGMHGAGGTQWDGVSGGRQRLLEMLSGYIEAVAPDVILTFDPRHGTTCHTDHRLTGELVVQATKAKAAAPSVLLLETRVRIHHETPLRLEFGVPAGLRPIVHSLDAEAEIAGVETGWDWLLKTMLVYSSQFNDEWIAAARRVPPEARRIYWASSTAALSIPISDCP